MNGKKVQYGGSRLALVLTVVVLVVSLLMYWKYETDGNIAVSSNILPPPSERINDEPQNRDYFLVGEISPGEVVLIDEVSLSQKGMIHIYKDINGTLKLIGKSANLDAGSHDRVTITLMSPVQDGDFLSISLKSSSGSAILDENGNPIEIQKNVGMLMQHYENEY